MHKDDYYLNALGITNYTFLGEGRESVVYDLGNETVLKLLKSYSPQSMQRKKALHFANQRVHFPLILETGPIADRGYVIERKLSGIPLSECLRKETDIRFRESLLYEMLETIAQTTRAIVFNESPYQELVAEQSHPADSWNTFFSNRVKTIYRINETSLKSNTNQNDSFLEDYLGYASSLFDGNIQKSLVHGDYWPPNLLVDRHHISAVLDFNDQTLVGDFRIDVASAVLFSRNFVSEAESKFLDKSAITLFGEDIAEYISLYAIYYALQFIGVEKSDKNSFLWAVEQLKNHRTPRR